MKISSKTILQGLERLKARVGVDGLFREVGDDLPLRSELFSVEQLEQHAEALADWHQIDVNHGADRLLARLASNEKVLLEAYRLVTEAVDNKRRISPAGEWLLDNFYLIEEQVRTARRHLPRQYAHGLPRLLNGPSAGYPRVYDLALELISHVDGRIDAPSLHSFVAAYQRRRHLKLGEMWAIPIMLRQALLENLRRGAARVAAKTLACNLAGEWADLFIEAADKSPTSLILLVADMARSEPELSCAFVAELARRLQGQNPALVLPLTWIEQRLAEQGESIELMIQVDAQQQTVNQVSIGNSINSLRVLDAIDWREFVESLSIVEQTLLDDPVGAYGGMDFNTRDEYRHVVEAIAKKTTLSEHEVAAQVVHLARQNLAKRTEPQLQETQGKSQDRTAHVGYFLIDKGLPELERAVGSRRALSATVLKITRNLSLFFYVGGIFAIAATVTAGMLAATRLSGGLAWLAALVLFMGATHLGIGLVNWIATLVVRPHRLPRMDFSEGIPPEYSTLVTVPTMLISERNVARLLELLEVRYLANRDKQLRFCLLTDFRDAPQEETPEDAALLQLTRAGIESLNEKYANEVAEDERSDIFFLFHRPRRWNAQEHTWMGYERKRGKLGDLNSLLLHGATDAFSLIVGDTSNLQGTKYVITLDTDTLLPRDAAQQLVGTMAHILNRAQVDERRRVVVEGYGILQPGVATSLEKGQPSLFVRLCADDSGVDPYSRTISDVYQDVFREGSFIGKGIYDVNAFATTMEQRFPENQILSHDLLEGCYARSGLVSDVHVYESFPSRYNTDVSRRHRWIRGDWQIAGWLLPWVCEADGRSERNPLGWLGRWKIFDNLRRSVVPAALTLLLLLSWLLLPMPWLWTVIVVGIVMIPAMGMSLVALFRKEVDLPVAAHLRQIANAVGVSIAQATLTIAFLPYEACFSLDAVLRTILRMAFTRTKMLEWKTASDAERDGGDTLRGSCRTMWISSAIAIAGTAALIVWRPESLWVALPILTLWLIAPGIAWKISQPDRRKVSKLTLPQTLFLHQIARKTWRFFDTFLGPDDHWLPPDNFQEYPTAVVAHRTSPTNIGVSLLSNLAAFDFGFIAAGELLERTSKTFASMDLLERFHGHFLNWYDTQSLQPLFPKYVSSVDSGNLSGHLLTLRRGLLELPDQTLISTRLWKSLVTTRQMLEVQAHSIHRDNALRGKVEEVFHILSRPPPTTLTAAQSTLREICA